MHPALEHLILIFGGDIFCMSIAYSCEVRGLVVVLIVFVPFIVCVVFVCLSLFQYYGNCNGI